MQNDLLDTINDIIKTGEGCPSAEDITQLEATYPYFIIPAILRLTKAESITDEERRKLCLTVALSCGDRTTLFRLIDSLGNKLTSFYPPEEIPDATTTEDALNTFIEAYSNINDNDTAQLEHMIFNPVPVEDYAARLEREDGVATQGQDAVFDAFLKEFSPAGANSSSAGAAVPLPADFEDDEPIRATRLDEIQIRQNQAKICISKGDYNRAYEIIRSLSLKYPEKSVYFADQLRFLEKLMLISKYKK
ncbi:MAG: hypothetical protein K2H50_00100 [Paramuribaculum sp.]|nr:hypothetical protein [Paramuribaculum sp.]